MEFINSQIHLNKIASIEDVQFEPLEQNYRKVQLYVNIIFFGILIVAGSIFAYLSENEIRYIVFALIGGLAVIALLSILLINVSFKRKGLAVRQRDIIYKSGLIFKKITTIPFNRIQHVELNQGPIEKRFNLGKLEIFTAGGASSDLKIPGLKYDQAQSLRAYIIQKTLNDEEE